MENLQKFPKEYFEACIYDEAHHTSAESFKRVMDYFTPKFIMDQAKYFGYSGERVKGLIFCSRIEEARELSRKFNEHGWRTMTTLII